ncbi:unconventional myosin-XVIIIb [Eudromia elegans]
MAISSRLALWEQKIREEDRGPPPSSPPLLFSVIPGGFIKQLVRETEKESKEAKLRRQAKESAKEEAAGAAEGAAPGTGQLPHNGPGGAKQGAATAPSTVPAAAAAPNAGKTAAPAPKAAATPRPEPPGAQSSPQGPRVGGSPPPPPRCRRGPASDREVPEGRGSTKKEAAAPKCREEPPGKGKSEGAPAKREPEKMKKEEEAKKEATGTKDPGKAKREPLDVKDPGKVKREPEDIKDPGKAGKEPLDSKDPRKAKREPLDVKDPGKAKKEPLDSKDPGKAKRETMDVKDLGKAKKELLDAKDPGKSKKERADIKYPGKTKKEPLDVKDPGKAKKELGDVKDPGKTKKEVQGSKVEQGGSRGTLAALTQEAPRDAWYEADRVWLLQQDGFALATLLKPDVGTPEPPPGRVRLRLEADGSVTEVDEDSVQRANPPSLDLAEDLASLSSLNEGSALHTLQQRFGARLCCTRAGRSLLAIRAAVSAVMRRAALCHAVPAGGIPRPPRAAPPAWARALTRPLPLQGPRDGAAAPVRALAQRAYRELLLRRRPQALLPLGRAGAGSTSCCRSALEHLAATAGGAHGPVTVEKIQAMFTVLEAFGSVTTHHSSSSTRFSMLLSLDFSAAGRITAAHLQTMLLESARVARQPHGESNFNVFAMMLAGLDGAQRTMLHLHQMAESNSFGIQPFAKGEERQAAAAAFARLQAALGALGIAAEEQQGLWRVLAAIYHLGAAGACKVGRKQFMRLEWAARAAAALGCELEELTTAVFKHHLKHIIERATARRGRPAPGEEAPAGPKMTGAECVEGMAAGLYEELFAAVVSLINRSFSSHELSVASIAVVDTPGFHNPRHQRLERAATFEELCHNYVHERLRALFYESTFVCEMERYREENVEVSFDLPELSPRATLSVVDLNPSQPQALPGSPAAGPRGLLWILDEEVLAQGSGDSAAFDRFCSYFAKTGADLEEDRFVRKCEQELHFEILHQLGTDPVRYDFTGWVNKAKLNLSAENAAKVLQQSRVNALRDLFLPRSRAPLACRSVAGLEGYSQAVLQRVGCVRKTFANSFAAVKRKSVCAQLRLQADALINLLRRSQLHFIHCLVPRDGAAAPEGELPLDVPVLRAQLAGAQLLDAVRLHRAGYADRLPLAQFWRRFQALAPEVMKKHTSAYEVPDESKAVEELFQALDLEKRSIAVGRSQVFLKPGVISRLEKQRNKLISPKIILLQAACKGFLSRQKFKKLKIQRLAVRCVQKNVAVYQAVRHWPWWQLMSRVRPLLSVNVAEDQLRAKEEELAALRRKLEKSEQSCSELRQNTEKLESKIIDLSAELADERYKGDAACQALDGERAERLRAARQLQELQGKHDQVQKKLESVEKQLEEAQQLVQLREMKLSGSGGGDEWQVRFECAQTEIGFLRKRLAQLDERLEAEQGSRAELEQKLGEARAAYDAAKKAAQQLRRKCRRLACELEDTRLLSESQQSRSHELEKKQKKFDLQLAQALGESAFEKSLREKVTQENSSMRWEMAKLQQSLEQKEAEARGLAQRAAQLAARVEELSAPSARDARAVPALRKQLWELEASAGEQQKELARQTAAVEHLEQLHQRLELEIERMKQIHQKELEDKDEELEDVRQSCQRRLRQLEMQLEQEYEERQLVLHEKQDLEGLIGTLCEQIGHRDFDVEKRLRRDLRRTRALLADVQLLLATSAGPGTSASKEELERARKQREESEARCAEAQAAQKTMALELENLHTELETLTRNKNLLEEQLYQLQHERADLLRRLDEDQEDLNELMGKHKALIAQSAADIAQIRELQTQVEEAKKEKQSLQEKLQAAEARLVQLGRATAERALVGRQEARVCDLQNRLEFQSVQIKRFEVLVLRLRDSIIKMGEELEKAAESEARQKENTRYYQMRMEEMKADMNELVQRELESSRRRMELEARVDELAAVRHALQADLETSIRRIADLQAALEEVQSGDESDADSVLTARESLCSRRDTDARSSVGSVLSLEPAESVGSWLGSALGWGSPAGSSAAGSVSVRSGGTGSVRSLRMSRDVKEPETARPASSLSIGNVVAAGAAKAASPLLGARRREHGSPPADKEERESQQGARESRGGTSPAPEGRFARPLSPAGTRRQPPAVAQDKLPSSSLALSEYVEELRRKRAAEGEQGARALDDASPLPIYQTTGASTLRRCRTFQEADDFPASEPRESGRAPGSPVPVRSSILKGTAVEKTEPARSPVLKRVSKFGSYDSLLQSMDRSSPQPSSTDTLGTWKLKSWRSCLEPSLEEGDLDVGKDPLVFQSTRFGAAAGEGKESDPFSWKIPTLDYERRTKVDFDDFLPALRKSRSTSSLAKPGRDRRDGQRPLTVRFEDEATTDTPGIKSASRQRPGAHEDSGNLSDASSSSGSARSFRSADSIKRRPPRAAGEGCSSAAAESPREPRRAEAEGREDDVNSIMKKYLGKD